MSNVYFIITQDGNISLVLKGNTHIVGKSHPNYDAIRECLKTSKYDGLEKLVDIPKAVNTYMDGNVIVNEFGEVTYQGQTINNTVANRITDFFQQGLPYKPLVRFLDNLMQNPSGRSVQELYRFLEHHGLPITEDGCFVAYKGVRDDFKDIHSGTFDNTPGQKPRLAARNLVDDDANRDCSFGLHVGTQSYASNFAREDGRVVLVKVNPADAVSVPHSDANKLRVVGYEVLCETDKVTVLDQPLYDMPTEPQPQEDDLCPDCGICPINEDDGSCQECDDRSYQDEGELDAVFEEGEQAFFDGVSRDNNPYGQGTGDISDSWNNGWQNASNENS